jgi:hypothetical protein
MYEERTVEALKLRLSNIKAHSFNVVDVRPYHKDGGVFVGFEFNASDPEAALETIKAEIKEEAKKLGGLPSWLDGVGAHFWLVEGEPWIEVNMGPNNISACQTQVLRTCGGFRPLLSTFRLTGQIFGRNVCTSFYA